MRLAPHQCVRADSRRSPADEQGQIIPLMIALMILILLAGMIVFWLGYSTSLGTTGQTAADAAALGGEQAAMTYLETNPTAVLDVSSLDPVACTAADRYAADNHAHVTSCAVVDSSTGFDTEVIVTTNDTLPSGAPDSGSAATARARASSDPFSQGSPTIQTSVSTSCDASQVTGQVFAAHGGDVGFFPADGADYSRGCEPKLAGALDKLAEAKNIKLDGTSGYVAESQADAKDPAAVAHSCGDASTTTGIPRSITDADLKSFGLVRPFSSDPDVVELSGVSCNQQNTTVDASASGTIGLGNVNVHLVPWSGGPLGTVSFPGSTGGISIGESPIQVGCQIYGVWQGLHLSQGIPTELLLVSLMVAQDESAMGQNIGINRSDPNQSVGVFQQISTDGWGTTAEELDVSTAAAMFFEGGHIPGRASTEGLIDVWHGDPGAPTWALAQGTQHSGAGQDSDGLANYGAPANVLAAQQMYDQVTSGGCPKA
jgi:hypothetical protein